jgi:membrane protein insertase Oxa1/YidC/SpoIIIJ
MNKLITPQTSNPDDASAQMTKSMGLMMPLFIAYLAYAYSAGLALYFVVSNLATILQYVLSGRIKLGNNKKA